MKDYLRSFTTGETLVQVIKVGLIGVVNTVVSLAIFSVMLAVLGGEEDRSDGFDAKVFTAVAVAFALTTLLSYVLNRRWTFDLDATGGTRAETAKFFAINGVALAVTQVVVTGANGLWGPLSNNALRIAYIGAAALIILPKFAGYRDVVFKRALDNEPDTVNSSR